VANHANSASILPWMSHQVRVPFAALDRHHAPIRKELSAAFERVVDASAYILGREVEAFEAEFAAYCNVRHCVAVGSGTAALTIALAAAGIDRGDEVIVPAHTFIASALSVVHVGATPVLCDVEPETGLLDVESAEAAFSQRTRAVMAVHLYGQCCAMDDVRSLADRHGALVIEDAAQAHGAAWRERRAGSLGDIAGFSFYPAKNLGALGEGGAVCTDDDAFAERTRALRDLGRDDSGIHALPGWNERMHGVQAALLRVKLPRLDAWNGARRSHAAAYRRALPAELPTLRERPESPCVYHLFPVRPQDRDELARALAEQGIQTGLHYTPALHEQPALEDRVRAPVPLQAATAWANSELSLPMFAELRADEIELVASIAPEGLAVRS
jgi:dTDP-4-amino-4,6-dideoxygalactose transaminase